MFAKDERRNDGWDVSAMALERARGGGTMVLNLWSEVRGPTLDRAATAGWDINRVATWEDLVSFARSFSRRSFVPEAR